MEKHILITVAERDISTKYFDGYESAQEQMILELTESLGGREDDYEHGKDTHSAWSNAGDNHDWLIEKIPKRLAVPCENYDGRLLENSGISLERLCAAEIMEHLKITAKDKKWYAHEDAITNLIIGVVEKYLT